MRNIFWNRQNGAAASGNTDQYRAGEVSHSMQIQRRPIPECGQISTLREGCQTARGSARTRDQEIAGLRVLGCEKRGSIAMGPRRPSRRTSSAFRRGEGSTCKRSYQVQRLRCWTGSGLSPCWIVHPVDRPRGRRPELLKLLTWLSTSIGSPPERRGSSPAGNPRGRCVYATAPGEARDIGRRG
jgi:hypothetical protein